MKQKTSVLNTLYMILIIAVTLVLIVFAVLTSNGSGRRNINKNIRSFSEGWETRDGREWAIEDVRIGGADEAVAYNTLPDDVTDDDAICFETRNINVKVMIEDREIYSFRSRENVTGMGYGYCYHIAGISAADAGKTVTVIFDGVVQGLKTGQIVEMYLAPSADFMRMTIRSKNLPRMLSFLIIWFGLFMILISFRVSDSARLPFNVGAFGVTVIMIGTWLLLDVNIMQLINGVIYLPRMVNMTVIFFAGYPLIIFLNSLTRRKRPVYHHIAFWFSLCTVATLVLLRYFAGVDMIFSFSKGIAFYVMGLVAIITALFIDNTIYCKANGIVVDLKAFYIGSMVFLACCLTDYLLFARRLFLRDSFGNVTRLGLLILIVFMLVRFFRWWTRDRASIERDRFMNRALQYAMSSDVPEICIHSMLEFMGTEMNAMRVLVFEDQQNGKYHGTYEWHVEGKSSAAVDLIYLPVKGLVDSAMKIMRSNGNRLVVKNSEDYRTVNPALYNMMKSNHVLTMVSSPLEAGERMNGLLVWVNIPRDELDGASEVIGMVSYFLSQLMLRRDEHKRLKFYSYNDYLTGVQNSLAYREYIEGGLDMSSAFGYLACEVPGPENTVYMPRYETVDRMVNDMAACLTEVFGKDHVYRVGATEFAAFGFEAEEEYFKNDVERVSKLAAARGLTPSVGCVYCAFGTMNFNSVINRAGELLREDARRH